MNILFIMSDDHAANAVSIYGSMLSQYMRTENLDSIGEDGAVLEQCFCTNAICTPSRATILTGQYSHKNGVRTLYDALSEDCLTFPEILQKHGYATALVGKWHLHSKPKGFDYYEILGFPWQQGKYFDPEFLNENSEWHTELEKDVSCREYHGCEERGYVTDIITDKALEWLENRDKSKPFLLMCHHKAPHDEFEFHPRYKTLLEDADIPEPESMHENKETRSEGSKYYGITVSERNTRRNMVKTMCRRDYPTGRLVVEGLKQEERTHRAYEKYVKDYLRTVKGIDDNVGRILAYLKANNLYENTMIIYTSDQGMLLGEHDYTDKRWIFDESMKMPFLIRVPGEVTGGKKIKSLICNTDFAPTILDFAGIHERLPGQQGESFRACLSGREPLGWRDCIYYRYWLHMTHCDTPAHYGIRTRDYKLVFYYGLPLDASGALSEPTPAGLELYDLKKDPLEMENVYSKKEYRQVRETLLKKLFEQKELLGDNDLCYPEITQRFQKIKQRGE